MKASAIRPMVILLDVLKIEMNNDLKKYFLVVVCLCLIIKISSAQKVTNITAEQIGQSIQVSYNLEAESTCNVSLFYSSDNGKNWQGPLIKVNGDVGGKISNGNKKMNWDVLNEVELFKFDAVVFKVKADLYGLKEVKIGNQIWSAENLNVDRYSNGDIIPQVTDATAWNNLTTGAWCYYDNKITNGTVYGKLYNWHAVADPRGLCPTGWHVPTDAEWTTLETILGGSSVAGGKLKEIGITHWASPNTGATNSSGFTVLPGGYRNLSGTCNSIGNFGSWWSATQSSAANAYYRYLYYDASSVNSYDYFKTIGFSVRCIKD